MKTRFVIGSLLLLAVAAMTTVAALESTAAVRRQGIAYFARPTVVAGQVIMGKTLIVHDDAKMARGEPCTTIYRYAHGRSEELVSFMCLPEARPAAEKFVVRCTRNRFNDVTDVLVEYQFSGETEAHGVPQW